MYIRFLEMVYNYFSRIKDHPQHGFKMLAGMWGAHTSLDRKLSRKIFNYVLNYYDPATQTLKQYDKIFLSDYVYRLIKRNSTIHDSYTCKRFRDSKPFPTERKVKDHIGSVFSPEITTTFFNEMCPIECRPKNHLNWIYC